MDPVLVLKKNSYVHAPLYSFLLDRNECKLGHQQGGHNCPAHSTCVNTIGSFECNCEDGFIKNANGRCEGILLKMFCAILLTNNYYSLRHQ